MNCVCKGSKIKSKNKNNQHIITIKGRSLIRTFLASATKDAAASSKVLSKLREKKEMNRFGSFKMNDYLCIR